MQRHRVKQAGFGYLTILAMIVMLGLVIGTAYQQQSKAAQREKENALLFIGQQYVQALASYYEKSPEGINELPNSIEALVLDKRFIQTTRHLRKAYQDPMTGGKWELILDPQKRIKGVYSLSNQPILQLNKFKKLQQTPSGQALTLQRYSDIKFEFEKKAKKTNQNEAM